MDPNRPKRFEFVPYTGSIAEYITGFLIAALLAVFASYLGLVWGNWMRRVQR